MAIKNFYNKIYKKGKCKIDSTDAFSIGNLLVFQKGSFVNFNGMSISVKQEACIFITDHIPQNEAIGISFQCFSEVIS